METNTNLLKALALMQFLGNNYILINDTEDPDLFQAFEGNEIEERDKYILYCFEKNLTEEDFTFLEFCNENLTEVEGIEGDEERENYMVLTDEEAQEKVTEYIKESIWAFNADFIIGECELDFSGEKSLQKMQSDSCENCNDFLLSLVEKTCGIETFVDDAIRSDGRGHFMSSYDSNENEETVEGETFYIYRIN